MIKAGHNENLNPKIEILMKHINMEPLERG
jgi:hypothetical protein